MKTITYRQALADAMESIMISNKEAIIYGLGVTDENGIFGTTVGLQKKFGNDRVFDTPICEDSNLGLGLGMALGGLYPINVHIRNDFLLLAMNQMINSISKYKYMYGGTMEIPIFIRAIIGKSWGQGAQHSQSLQSIFSHFPGLTVIMPATAQSIATSYVELAKNYRSPVISLEYRTLFDCEFSLNRNLKRSVLGSHIERSGTDVTILATSFMVIESLKAAKLLYDVLEIQCEVIDVHSISHPDKSLILESITKIGKLLIADTSWAQFGVAAEVSRWICESDPSILKRPIFSLCLAPSPCPTSHALEMHYYPNIKHFIVGVLDLLNRKTEIDKVMQAVGEELSTFKGPF